MRNLEAKSVINAMLRQPSLVDYPGHLGVLMFTSGCNFRCGFCHNVDLIGDWHAKTFSFAILKQRLEHYREEWVKAVTISGGEPTIHEGLPDTIAFFKEEGFLVKLDTNGSHPEMLRDILAMVDYVAMDVKCSLPRYPEFVHYGDIQKIRDSIALIRQQAKDYEFRTTILESFHTLEEIRQAGQELQGAKRWIFQPFVPHENLPQESLRTASRTKPSFLQECADVAKAYVQEARIR